MGSIVPIHHIAWPISDWLRYTGGKLEEGHKPSGRKRKLEHKPSGRKRKLEEGHGGGGGGGGGGGITRYLSLAQLDTMHMLCGRLFFF